MSQSNTNAYQVDKKDKLKTLKGYYEGLHYELSETFGLELCRTIKNDIIHINSEIGKYESNIKKIDNDIEYYIQKSKMLNINIDIIIQGYKTIRKSYIDSIVKLKETLNELKKIHPSFE